MRYGHLWGPQRGKSSWAPRGIVIGQSASSRGGEMNSSTHKRANPGMPVVFSWAQGRIPLVVWPPLAPKWLACQGQVHLLVLSLWVSVRGPFPQMQESWGPTSPHPTCQDLVDLPFQVGGKTSVELLHCSAEHPLGHSRMDGTPLEGHCQCHPFFMPHYLIILSSLELLWRR